MLYRLDLQTLGCPPVMMPKNLSDHWLPFHSPDGKNKQREGRGEVFEHTRLHVDIFPGFRHCIGVYAINSSKMIGNFLTSLELQPVISQMQPVPL